MNLTPEITNQWLSGQSVTGADYDLDDAVRVIHGPHAGRIGTVRALERLHPEPTYVIETRHGEHLTVSQSDIASET